MIRVVVTKRLLHPEKCLVKSVAVSNDQKKFSTISSNRLEPPKTGQLPLVISRRNFSYQESVNGIWKSLSNSQPVSYVQDGLVQLHEISGLPWWATIVASTFILRSCVTLPLAVYQNKIMARLELIALEMPAIVKELKQEAAYAMKKYNWTENKTRAIYNSSLKKQWNKLVVRENCHPAKTMIILWGQIPLWICQSVAIRNLVAMLPDPSAIEAQIMFAQLTVGGFGWIPNLTEVEASFILPVALGLTNLAIIEIQTMTRTRKATRFHRYATNFFRILSVAMIPIAASVPSSLCLYWASSSAYGLGQNLLLMSPRVRRFVGIPKTASEFDAPYKQLGDAMSARWQRLTQLGAAKSG